LVRAALAKTPLGSQGEGSKRRFLFLGNRRARFFPTTTVGEQRVSSSLFPPFSDRGACPLSSPFRVLCSRCRPSFQCVARQFRALFLCSGFSIYLRPPTFPTGTVSLVSWSIFYLFSSPPYLSPPRFFVLRSLEECPPHVLRALGQVNLSLPPFRFWVPVRFSDRRCLPLLATPKFQALCGSPIAARPRRVRTLFPIPSISCGQESSPPPPPRPTVPACVSRMGSFPPPPSQEPPHARACSSFRPVNLP